MRVRPLALVAYSASLASADHCPCSGAVGWYFAIPERHLNERPDAVTVTHRDVLDALEYAAKNGAAVSIDPSKSKAENYAAIMQAGDDAGQAALARHTFVECACCSHRT